MALETKKQEIDKLLEQEKALYTTFSTAMGENNKFENFLTKVFKKKIKRAKKKPQVWAKLRLQRLSYYTTIEDQTSTCKRRF